MLYRVVLAFIFTWFAALAQAEATLTVTARGEVRAIPDMATRERTALAATRAASDKIAAILDLLGQVGVAGEDIQTTSVTLTPIYEPRRPDLNRAPRLEGFEAGNTLKVVVRQLDNIGPILDAVIEAGANSFRGLSFGLQDPEFALEDARKEAVTKAMAKAQTYATAAGMTRGPIISIQEGSRVIAQPEFARAMMASDAVPVAPGSVTMAADVTIVFSLK
ncbi:MAG: SIMPL domain-containing protein [Mangrovicoccus sp.]